MIMASVHLIAAGAASSREEIAEGLRGNLCRCTGYSHIIDAVRQAAAQASAAQAERHRTSPAASGSSRKEVTHG
jgi:aerobic-type carbon monoxide dehydrogenase small subunit (CoxS/CutS family)